MLSPKQQFYQKENPLYPDFTADLQHEVEIVIKICKLGKNIQKKFANKYYHEIGLGIDFTARDLQTVCKEKRTSLGNSKAFDNSAVIGKFIPKENLDLLNIQFHLKKNGDVIQNGEHKRYVVSL